MPHRPLAAFLYAVALACATPAAATPPQVLERMAELRAGDMRKLVVHDAPRPVPAIRFTTADGAARTLADSDGKVRVINFWATWCAPCREEKPALDALNAELGGEDFAVIAIATGRNSLDGIARFNAEHGIETLTTYLDDGMAAARAMGVLGLPVSVILDREGREIARLQGGADWTSASARAIIGALIAAPAGG